VDWYGARAEPMTSSPSFLHWYEFAEPTGLPLFVVEYGQSVIRPGERSTEAGERARAAALRADAEWIAEHPRVSMWLYWQGTGPRGDWRMYDAESRSVWRDVAARGCRR
jgi:hypothetical protein